MSQRQRGFVGVVLVMFLALLVAHAATRADQAELGFESDPLVANGWVVPTPGWTAELTDEQPSAGTHCAKLGKKPESASTFGNLMRTIDAAPYRGKRVALSSKIRVVGDGRSQMWIRIDRANDVMGGFDNMSNRPVFGNGEWTTAMSEVDVAADALAVNVGFMVFGAATAFVDEVALEVKGDAAPVQAASPLRALTARGLENVRAAVQLLNYVRFFHPSDQAVGVASWGHVAIDVIEQAEPAVDAADLARRLSTAFAPLAPTLEMWAGDSAAAPALPNALSSATNVRSWRHVGAGTIAAPSRGNAYSSAVTERTLSAAVTPTDWAASFLVKRLDGGVSFRLPIQVYGDEKGTIPHGSTPPALMKDAARPVLESSNRSTRLAAIAMAWGVFQHFYPYFEPDGDLTPADWDSALTAALETAATDADATAMLATLQTLVATLHDGHGNVSGGAAPRKAMLPVLLEWAGDELVVVGVHASADKSANVGDVVLAIDGRTTAECFRDAATRISGATDGWIRSRSTMEIATGAADNDPAVLSLRGQDGVERNATLRRIPLQQIAGGSARRPETGSELAPGIVYFDLNAAELPALTAVMPRLETAKGIVFDMRGYPGGAAYSLIQHLIDAPATSARWRKPVVTMPDREGWTWDESGRWSMPHSRRGCGHRSSSSLTGVRFLTLNPSWASSSTTNWERSSARRPPAPTGTSTRSRCPAGFRSHGRACACSSTPVAAIMAWVSRPTVRSSRPQKASPKDTTRC